MAFQIIWSAEAHNDFFKIITYLKENWSDLVAEKFVTQTNNKLERLASTPSIARATNAKSVYMYKIDTKKVLFFSSEENNLVLLSIYSYKKDIKKSKYY
jgi:plasmid stabilization system protein ParE